MNHDAYWEKTFTGLKVPVAILGAETDHISPPEVVKKFSEILSSKPEVPNSLTHICNFVFGLKSCLFLPFYLHNIRSKSSQTRIIVT